jgi:methylated-DNA-[protein]-cysteine S-methyltransferase
MIQTFYTTINTPVGFLKITTSDIALLSVEFSDKDSESDDYQPEILKNTIRQLNEYFQGERTEFSLNLDPGGTEFQKKIWQLVYSIPFGKTVSYLEIARNSGSEKNTRAVGLANGKNPIPIIIPCHRVIGVSGKMTGYAGGIERKKWLLIHEQNIAKPNGKLF